MVLNVIINKKILNIKWNMVSKNTPPRERYETAISYSTSICVEYLLYTTFIECQQKIMVSDSMSRVYILTSC